MASPATTTLPPLEVPHEREGVGQELQATLHELVDLSLIGNQLHWAVVRPLFRALHLRSRALCSRAMFVVRDLTHRIAEVSERVGGGMYRLGGADLASQDMLIQVVRNSEEQQWMLRAQLGEDA